MPSSNGESPRSSQSQDESDAVSHMPMNRRRPAVRQGHDHPIGLENGQRAVRLRFSAVERFLQRLTGEMGLASEAFFIRFVTDQEMARLNRTFRQKAKTTDVLSFPAEERDRPTDFRACVNSLHGSFLGDIAISPAVARANAKSFGRTLEQEICVLILHGFLHLLGYDHETDRGEMERVELKLRRRLGLA